MPSRIAEDELIRTILDTDDELQETQALMDWYRRSVCEALSMLAETQRQLETARATNAKLIDELREARVGRLS